MKVLLVYPTNEKVNTKPSLGLMSIASILRDAGHQVKILEGDHKTVLGQWLKKSFFPDFIGFTCMTSMYKEIVLMRDYFHQWNIPLVFGGPHATVLPESLLNNPHDFVVVGEGEQIILKIVNDEVNPGIIQGILTQNLDILPFPSRDLVNPKYFRHSASLMASRGCPFNCSFCQPTLRKMFGKKTRRRTPWNVLEEICEVHQKYRVKTFEFFDDTFTADQNFVYDFCDLLMLGKTKVNWEILTRVDMLDHDLLKMMKTAGLKVIRLGIESGSQEILNSYSKGVTVEQSGEAMNLCNKLGIKVHGFFMLGAIDETKGSIQETKHFIENHEFDTIFIAVTTPMPGTRLYEQAKKEDCLLTDWRNVDYLGSLCTTVSPLNYDDTVVMKLKYLSNHEILDAKYDILKNFYLRKARNPAYLFSFIRKNSLGYTLKAIKNVLSGR